MSFHAALVVMAAGMGSRFGGLKQLEPIGKNGEVILDFSVYDAIEAGFDKIVFVIKHEIEEDFKRLVGERIAKKVEVEYVFQEIDALPEGFTVPNDRTKPWGTGHAILCCKDAVSTPFAVVNADDYYGKTAFSKMYNYLKEETGEFGMVGFRLVNTLTENGTVSRGVCSAKDGFLTEVVERTKIDANCRYTLDGENWVQMSPDTVVSMNMWGFTPEIFKYLEAGFSKFLKENLLVPKSEYFLPSVVGELIEKGEKKVKVLVAEDKWYGVTYKEDKEAVVGAITSLMDKGLYDNI
ncbi:MAG: sugar phosphate nucleotidyltransferase [Acutalibacteraceae bacterium]|nr:sugar phosphate nucleotidyltransferase [Acutalibacteraceae bacterium]